MPELPEVETTKTSLEPLIDRTVSRVRVFQSKLRYPMADNLDSLIGYRLTSTRRRAKYLLLDFTHTDDNAQKTLLIHLGMSGSLQQHSDLEPRKHDHLLIDFIDDNGEILTLHYHDPRRFGMILWTANDDFITPPDTEARFLSHLGPEPLSDDFNADYLADKIFPTHKKPLAKPIKALIMDQSVVVGVGNIYAAESLFLSAIHPATPAHRLDKAQIATLVDNIKSILAIAIKKGGSSLKDFSTGSGKTGYFQQTLLVYGRENQPCTVCGTPLENIKITGRASVYCPICQPIA